MGGIAWADWWSYRPSDFLMFAPATYWRLFELHNAACWPAQPVLVAAGLAVLPGLARGSEALWRCAAAVLAGLLAGCAAAFVAGRYAPVNWAAEALVPGLLALALGLFLAALRHDTPAAPPRRRRIGLALIAWALLAHPLLASAAGRPLAQAEVFGLAPDPTVIAALGLLLCRRASAAWLTIPTWTLAIAWCAISAATLWTMGSAQGWVLAGAALAAGFGAIRPH